jgi:hypothetical protein
VKAIARAIPVTEMNRDEQRYADSLDLRKIAGEVSWWAFGSLRFRLADGAWYKPDFFVVLLDGSCVLVEV